MADIRGRTRMKSGRFERTAYSARQAELDFRKTIDSLTAEDIATVVAYAIETPDRMSVSEIMIRPTKQGI